MIVVLGAAKVDAAQSGATIPAFSPSPDVGWVAMSNEYFPPPNGPGPTSFDPNYPYVPNNTPEQPTYRVADLSNPNLKSWVLPRMKRANDLVIAGGIGFTPRSSCMPAGLPTFMLFVGQPVYFFQTPDMVAMIYSGDAQIRRVYMDVPHSIDPKLSWYGESVGHYEGDTLVIDTIGLDTRSYVDHYRTPHSEALHIVERWRLVDAGSTLEVRFTVEDPESFNAPWSGMQRYRRVQQNMTETPCAENNGPTVVADYQIPVAERLDF